MTPQDNIKEIYEDGIAEINGVEFVFSKFRHEQRLKVFSFVSSLQDGSGNIRMDFWDDPKFFEVMELIEGKVTVEGQKIKQIKDFWEENADVYVQFVMVALQVIPYPFMRGMNGS